MTHISRTRHIVLARRPDALLTAECLSVVESAVPDCPPGGVLVGTEYLSCDPYLRLRMRDTFALGQVIPARAVGTVLHSRDSRWNVGDRVWGPMAWGEHVVADPAKLHPVDPHLLRPSYALSVCGIPGLTAHAGMMGKGRPRAGEQVVVSGAAGAIGSIAGQLAVNAGAHVVGIVGSEHKARHIVDNLGFHGAVVRAEPSVLVERLRAALPNGVDVCFENVGAAVLDAVLTLLRPRARIVLCGMAADYDSGASAVTGLMSLCGPEASLHGLNVVHHMDDLNRVSSYMSGLVNSGALHFHEDIVRGIERLPDAFVDMVNGGSIGKRIVEMAI